MRIIFGALVLALSGTGCGAGSHVAGPGDAGPDAAPVATADDGGPGMPAEAGPSGAQDSAIPPPASTCVTAAQLEAWQQQIDLYDGGNRPTGSPAHEGYIQRLTQELRAVGVPDVHTEPYAFTKWTPSTWSLSVGGHAVSVSAYVPYSGSTGPLGVDAPLAYVPGFSIPVDAGAIAGALQNPAAFAQSLTASLEATLAATAGTLAGRIVVFELPQLAVTLATLTGTTLAIDDPGHTLSMSAPLTRPDLAAMLVMPAMLDALASAGALGAVGILDSPKEAAQGEYAPFFGPLTANLPALYVDRDTGAALRSAITSPPLPPIANLVLAASLAPATSENVVGVLPGVSSEEILLGSHTDGPNAIEDNGPVAILALMRCLSGMPVAQRPRTIRVVLSGGHFAGSVGLTTYVGAHTAELTANAMAVLELEHLGAREWAEVSPGVMGLTGRPEVQVVTTWQNAPLVTASKAFASQFPRTVVGTPPVLGEGQNFRIVPLVQLISMPQYLLLRGLPVTQQLTDFDLMQRQVLAVLAMEEALALAPAEQLGVAHGMP